MYEVLVSSTVFNRKLLKQLDLKAGRDYWPVKGAVAAGRPHQLLLEFKDRDKAMIFKLRSEA